MDCRNRGRAHSIPIWLASFALCVVGCSKESAETATPLADPQVAALNPKEAVSKFLDAVRVGDDATAALMLSDLARKKTTEMNMVIAPPGSKTATFEVGEVELVAGGAHVAATWSDFGEDGKKHSDTIVWILRQEPEGWRIAGMATKLFNDMPPLILNFEDPEDMVRKQQMAEQEIAKRNQAADPAGHKAAAVTQNAEVPARSELK